MASVVHSRVTRRPTKRIVRTISKTGIGIRSGQATVKVERAKRSKKPMDVPEILIRTHGMADVSTNRPANTDTRFCLGSVTRGFTAALLLQLLHDNGTLTLDSPVQSFLGKEFLLSKPSLTERTTFRDILADRVGIAPYFGGFVMGYNMTRQELVRRLRYVPAVGVFRESCIPNPLMYVLAGHLAEKLNATFWENAITQRLFKPLGMTASIFADRVPNWADGFALPHVVQDGKLVPLMPKITGNILRPVGPSGSICSTPADMSRWMLLMLTNGLSTLHDAVLHPSVVESMLTPQNFYYKSKLNETDSLPVDLTETAYNLGWISGTYKGHNRVFHDGFSNYYGSFVTLYPELGIGIFTAGNGPSKNAMDNAFQVFHMHVADLLLGEDPWLNSTTACSFPEYQSNSTEPVPANVSDESVTEKEPLDTLNQISRNGVTIIENRSQSPKLVIKKLKKSFLSSTEPYSTHVISDSTFSTQSVQDSTKNAFGASSEDLNEPLTELSMHSTPTPIDYDEMKQSATNFADRDNKTYSTSSTFQTSIVPNATRRTTTTLDLQDVGTMMSTFYYDINDTDDEISYDAYLQSTPFEMKRIQSKKNKSTIDPTTFSNTELVSVTDNTIESSSSNDYYNNTSQNMVRENASTPFKVSVSTMPIETTIMTFTEDYSKMNLTNDDEIGTSSFSDNTVTMELQFNSSASHFKKVSSIGDYISEMEYFNDVTPEVTSESTINSPLPAKNKTKVKIKLHRPGTSVSMVASSTTKNRTNDLNLESVEFNNNSRTDVFTEFHDVTDSFVNLSDYESGEYGKKMHPESRGNITTTGWTTQQHSETTIPMTTPLDSTLDSKTIDSVSEIPLLEIVKVTDATTTVKYSTIKEDKPVHTQAPQNETDETAPSDYDISDFDFEKVAKTSKSTNRSLSTTMVGEHDLEHVVTPNKLQVTNNDSVQDFTPPDVEMSAEPEIYVTSVTPSKDSYLNYIITPSILESDDHDSIGEYSQFIAEISPETETDNGRSTIGQNHLTTSDYIESGTSRAIGNRVLLRRKFKVTTPEANAVSLNTWQKSSVLDETTMTQNSLRKSFSITSENPATETGLLLDNILIITSTPSYTDDLMSSIDYTSKSNEGEPFKTLGTTSLTLPKAWMKPYESSRSEHRRFPIPSRRRLSGRRQRPPLVPNTRSMETFRMQSPTTAKFTSVAPTILIQDNITEILRRFGVRLPRDVRNPFPKHVGTYGHYFFGNIVVFFNRTAQSLQMDYGLYGKAHLVPDNRSDGITFAMHFFSAIWYTSESDDNKNLPSETFLVRFNSSRKGGAPQRMAIPFFEPKLPPVFVRDQKLPQVSLNVPPHYIG